MVSIAPSTRLKKLIFKHPFAAALLKENIKFKNDVLDNIFKK